MYFYTFSKSILLVFDLFSVNVYFLLLKNSVLSYCKLDCEGETINTDDCRCVTDSTHLFDLQSDY